MSGRVFLAASVVLGITFASRADDLLDRFKKENEVKSAKLISDAKEALKQSKFLEATNPKKARDRLQEILNQLEAAELKDQKTLIGQVRSKVDQLDRLVRDQQDKDRKIINQGIREKELREANQPKTPPRDNVADFANRYISKGKNSLEIQALAKKMQEEGRINLNNDINFTYANSFKENRMPERYIWALEHRQKDKLTKEEKAILKALNSVMTVDWKDIKLKEAIELIQEKANINILVHQDSLKEAEVSYNDDKVTVQGKKLSVRTILKKILGEYKLAYIIKEGNIHVITSQQAREMMITKHYPVADLVSGDPRFGGFLGQAMLIQNVASLIQLIQNTVDPPIWQNGATINFYQPTMSLAIRAPAELHLQMGFGLGKR